MAASFSVRLIDNGGSGLLQDITVSSGESTRQMLAGKLVGNLNDYVVRVNGREDVLDEALVPNALIVVAPRNFKGA